MAKRAASDSGDERKTSLSMSPDDLLLGAMARGAAGYETGRHIVTFKEGALGEGVKALESRHGFRTASARDFKDQAVDFEGAGAADALAFPEIGSALVAGVGAEAKGLRTAEAIAEHPAVESIDPEMFVFSCSAVTEYLQGFRRATETIINDLGRNGELTDVVEIEPEVLGNTWGLGVCKVVPSAFSGKAIKVAVLDTGMDLGHPEFAGRTFVTRAFVPQPVQDLHGHGTHTTGTACGPKAPPGAIPRYGIGYQTGIFVGKVLTNSGTSVGGSVLAGMNWAVANRCEVISMSLAGQGPVQPSYTAAGKAALSAGCLVVAAAGNAHAATGFPANSPTILSVAALNPNLTPAAFSNFGKIEIAAPGVGVFSSTRRPLLHATMDGTSMATPHVSGCAALWAQSDPSLRGLFLWRKLIATAKKLPFPPKSVGAGLVQAP